jgi:Uma2 family endonuclease
VVADPAQVSKRGIEGAPLLAIEVLSPGTARGDRELKPLRLASHRVPHYWLVDPADRSIDCNALSGSRYRLVARFSATDRFAHPAWPELTIDLAGLWREPRAVRRQGRRRR